MASWLQKALFIKNKSYIKQVGSEKQYICDVEDYDTSFEVPRAGFKTVGIRATYKDSKFATLCWILFFWLEYASLLVGLYSEFHFAAVAVRDGKTMEIFGAIPCSGYAVLSILKAYKIVVCRPVLENIVDELRDMFPKGPIPEEEYNVVMSNVTLSKMIARGYYWCNMLLLILFSIPPIGSELLRFVGYNAPKSFPLMYWFPFDAHQPYLYEFLLILQIWQAYVVLIYLISSDTVFFILLNHVSTQFDLLSIRIQNLLYVPIDQQLLRSYPLGKVSEEYDSRSIQQTMQYDDQEWEGHQRNELVQIINRHQALIRLAGDIEYLNSFSLLVNFFNSSIVICCCGFCAVIVEKLTEIKYKAFLVTTLTQTWLLCWHGHRLIESSENISEALYKCGWYQTSKKIRTIIYIMINRAQKDVHVTTYGFSVLSLATYTSIIKSAWSYFTLLHNVYNK